ncbi:MAG: TonB-dependent receptor, partial [Blastocatellia bacterium]
MALLRFLFFALLSFLLAVSSQAQPANLTIRGRVADSNGASLTGASVTLGNLTTGFERIAITDAAGGFLFPAVQNGRYKLTVTATGFGTASQVVESVTDEAVEFKLEPARLADRITVVSGSRQEELRESLNTKVDVIGRNRIRDTGYESVAEVLQELPGVLTRRGTASGNSGSGGEQIQGIDSRQVLVLFDGQPVTGARGIKSGVLNLDRQSISPLESIEVVKGASSALYGSDAIGGVINQISRDPK